MGNDLFGEIVRGADLVSITPTKMSSRRGDGRDRGEAGVLINTSGEHYLNEDRDELAIYITHMILDDADDLAEIVEDEGRFFASITYEVLFRFSTPLTPEHEPDLNRFAQHQGRFSSWGYLRSYLSSVAGDYQLPPLTLPLLKPHAPAPVPGDDESEL